MNEIEKELLERFIKEANKLLEAHGLSDSSEPAVQNYKNAEKTAIVSFEMGLWEHQDLFHLETKLALVKDMVAKRDGSSNGKY